MKLSPNDINILKWVDAAWRIYPKIGAGWSFCGRLRRSSVRRFIPNPSLLGLPGVRLTVKGVERLEDAGLLHYWPDDRRHPIKLTAAGRRVLKERTT